MMAFAKALRRTSVVEIRTHFLMFCGACLFVWLLHATYGLDLSPGLF